MRGEELQQRGHFLLPRLNFVAGVRARRVRFLERLACISGNLSHNFWLLETWCVLALMGLAIDDEFRKWDVYRVVIEWI